ncbi:MAG: hypothetical protein KAS81_00665 [Anaerolineales bacterium]|nr:hypothetical protein [Anaerolineales bacterium]NOR82314.1 hypothetical protein [Ardenticatenales bacterium]
MHSRCQLGVAINKYNDGNKIRCAGSHGEVFQVGMIAGDEDRSGLPIPGIEQARDEAVEPL